MQELDQKYDFAERMHKSGVSLGYCMAIKDAIHAIKSQKKITKTQVISFLSKALDQHKTEEIHEFFT